MTSTTTMMPRVIGLGAITALGMCVAAPAQAQQYYMGEIITTAATYCPRGSQEANGAVLSISQNDALFSLIGTTYGGDGWTTFNLPDLRGRVAIGDGHAKDLQRYALGDTGGAEAVAITLQQSPSHDHEVGIKTVNQPPNTTDPHGNAFTTTTTDIYNKGTDPGPVGNRPRFMNAHTAHAEPSGGGQAHENRMPYVTVKNCIMTQGIFPRR